MKNALSLETQTLSGVHNHACRADIKVDDTASAPSGL